MFDYEHDYATQPKRTSDGVYDSTTSKDQCEAFGGDHISPMTFANSLFILNISLLSLAFSPFSASKDEPHARAWCSFACECGAR